MGVGAIELELPKDVGYNGKLYYEGGVEAKEPIDKSKKIFFKTAKGNFYEVTNKDAAIDKNGKAISTAGKMSELMMIWFKGMDYLIFMIKDLMKKK